MVKKRIVAFLLLIIWIMSSATGVLALTTVNLWISDEQSVYYRALDGSYYVTTYGNDSSFNSTFRSAISHACSQWSAALPISICETSFNYALSYIYGGTIDELSETFPELSGTVGGRTYYGPKEFVETIYYNGQAKDVYSLTAGGRMCVVKDSTLSTNKYKTIATHEMGHLFGWYGHSASAYDVMWSKTATTTVLSANDKAHLKQIYTLFY